MKRPLEAEAAEAAPAAAEEEARPIPTYLSDDDSDFGDEPAADAGKAAAGDPHSVLNSTDERYNVVVLPRATIYTIDGTFDVDEAKDEIGQFFDRDTGLLEEQDPRIDRIVLPIFDGRKTYYAYIEPFKDTLKVKVSVYGEGVMMKTSLKAPIEMSLSKHQVEEDQTELYIDRFYETDLEDTESLKSKKKFKEYANNWPGYGVRGMMLVEIVANVLDANIVSVTDDDYVGVISNGLYYDSMAFSEAMKKIFENGGELPEGMPQIFLKYYEIIQEFGDRKAIERVIKNRSYFGRYGFERNSRGYHGVHTDKHVVRVPFMYGTAADFKTSSFISPRWHIATSFC